MTAPLWLPGATVVKALQDGGSMLGSDAYATWHTFECDYKVPAVNGARVLNAEGFAVTLVFHPITGDIVQMIPANRAGRGLMNEAGGVETNRQGRVNVQIEVIGRAANPWTKDLTPAGRVGLARIIRWLDALGVPRTAPNGNVGPGSYAASAKRARSVTAWNGPGGYFCHGDIPENDHWDHGPIDMRDLWAATSTATITPKEFTVADAKDANVLWTTPLTKAGTWPSGAEAESPLTILARTSRNVAAIAALIKAQDSADDVAAAVVAALPQGQTVSAKDIAAEIIAQLAPKES